MVHNPTTRVRPPTLVILLRDILPLLLLDMANNTLLNPEQPHLKAPIQVFLECLHTQHLLQLATPHRFLLKPQDTVLAVPLVRQPVILPATR